MNETWVFAAGLAVWIGLGVWAAFLALSQRRLADRVAQLELLLRDSGEDTSA